MKLSLKVAQGVHEGKLIPVPVAQFLIGREESCQLRPASPAVSKRHCAIQVRSDKVYVRDIGSTNGTFINDQQITQEVEVQHGDRLKIGPLEFVIQIEKSATAKPAAKLSPSEQAVTPKPAVAETLAEKPKSSPSHEEESEQLAAMLLGTDDGPPEPITADKIPAGTTVFELPAIGQEGAKEQPKPKDPNEGNTSNAAAAILKKYMQRPRST